MSAIGQCWSVDLDDAPFEFRYPLDYVPCTIHDFPCLLGYCMWGRKAICIVPQHPNSHRNMGLCDWHFFQILEDWVNHLTELKGYIPRDTHFRLTMEHDQWDVPCFYHNEFQFLELVYWKSTDLITINGTPLYYYRSYHKEGRIIVKTNDRIKCPKGSFLKFAYLDKDLRRFE